MSDSIIKDKSKTEILAMVGNAAQPGSRLHEQLLAAVTVRCTEDLERALKSLEDSQTRSSASTEQLARRVFWLNVIITIATVVGALATLAQAFRLFHGP
jgi:hypothetical protein